MKARWVFLLGLWLALCSTAEAQQQLRAGTATQVAIGPFLDGTDGVTEETGLDVTEWDCGLIKHADSSMAETSLTITATSGDNDAAHVANGNYSLELTATDTATVGRLRVSCSHGTPATFIPVWEDFEVISADVWDATHGALEPTVLENVVCAIDAVTDADTFSLASCALPTTNDLLNSKAYVSIVDATDSNAIVPCGIILDWTGSGTSIVDMEPDCAVTPTTSDTALVRMLPPLDFDTAEGTIADAQVDNDVQVDVVTIETGDATDALAAGATAAIEADGLDHLVAASVTGTDVTDNSIIAKMVGDDATADWDSFDNTTESFEALRNHIGDGTNLTEAGGDGDHLTEAGGTGDQLTAIPMTDIVKNAAFNDVPVLMVDATDGFTPETGLTLSCERSLDGGAFSAVSGSVAEISDGFYQFDAAAADTNGDVVIWRCSASGAADWSLSFRTK